ncbi:uncharacterized protein GIQ15_03704 [Arthroderma uncinatum]|uniref:uncharacterized protein n=1 Tax=Arthroderma uncinatum TaxID=74035 RepID=UPI00144A888B|nr:uncharacterized protein GIQ15_03704 [Arthroderma uncinatum]KAF3484380.1 hypothetical protein GIQ15_03704 [Arthroderma uncinatum]
MLVSGSYDEAVFLWDVRSARIMRSLPAHSDPVAGVDFVRDGTLIVSCAGDGLIRIWDSATGQCLRTLVHEDNPPVSSVRFSPNGKFILAWSLDGCVRLWNYVEGRCIKTYQGHTNEKYSITGAFGSYGHRRSSGSFQDRPGLAGQHSNSAKEYAYAASGSEDGTILCWDVINKKILQTLEGHSDVVLGVDAFTPPTMDRKRLMASCGLDQTVRIWEELEDDSQEEMKEGDTNQTDEGPRDFEMIEHLEEDKPAEEKGTDEKSDAGVENAGAPNSVEGEQRANLRPAGTDMDSDGDLVMG